MILTTASPKYSENTTLPTMTSIWTGLGTNADFRLSRDTAGVLLETLITFLVALLW